MSDKWVDATSYLRDRSQAEVLGFKQIHDTDLFDLEGLNFRDKQLWSWKRIFASPDEKLDSNAEIFTPDLFRLNSQQVWQKRVILRPFVECSHGIRCVVGMREPESGVCMFLDQEFIVSRDHPAEPIALAVGPYVFEYFVVSDCYRVILQDCGYVYGDIKLF